MTLFSRLDSPSALHSMQRGKNDVVLVRVTENRKFFEYSSSTRVLTTALVYTPSLPADVNIEFSGQRAVMGNSEIES